MEIVEFARRVVHSRAVCASGIGTQPLEVDFLEHGSQCLHCHFIHHGVGAVNLEGDIGFCHRRHHAAAEADVALSVACQAWHHAVGLFFCWGCRQRAEICGKQRGDRVGREIACDDILPIGGIGYLLRIEAQGVVVVESVEVGAV